MLETACCHTMYATFSFRCVMGQIDPYVDRQVHEKNEFGDVKNVVK